MIIIYPVLSDPDFFSIHMSDQFAFRPTGSTIAALIFMLHHLTDMATKYDYVH